jgi:hypothetical protein
VTRSCSVVGTEVVAGERTAHTGRQGGHRNNGGSVRRLATLLLRRGRFKPCFDGPDAYLLSLTMIPSASASVSLSVRVDTVGFKYTAPQRTPLLSRGGGERQVGRDELLDGSPFQRRSRAAPIHALTNHGHPLSTSRSPLRPACSSQSARANHDRQVDVLFFLALDSSSRFSLSHFALSAIVCASPVSAWSVQH